LTVAD